MSSVGKQGFDKRQLTGPFDIVGDVHGCIEELEDLLLQLGYINNHGHYEHPQGRTFVFLGDLNDRGPDSAATFALAMQMAAEGTALYTPGNHCNKLLRYLEGRNVQLKHGLRETVAQVEARDRVERGFKRRLRRFIENAPPYLWLDRGALVVAHGGIRDYMIGEDSSRVHRMVLYGDITGEVNPDGTPVRLDWAQHYRGAAAIIYGHTPNAGPKWVNNTLNIDQGCVFGGWLTALRWPERHILQVRARRPYYTERTPAFLAGEVQAMLAEDASNREPN